MMPKGIKHGVQQAMLFARDIAAPFMRSHEISILCYHSVSDIPFVTNVTAQELESHLQFLKAQGIVFVSLSDIEAWRMGTRVLPEHAVALTFDDGYADFESTTLPLLKKFQAPATLFVLGEPEAARAYLGQENSFLSVDALERLRTEPLVELGYHSATHPSLERLEVGDLLAEVKRPDGVRYFAYPGGHYSKDVVDAVKAAGYEAAYSIKPDLVCRDSDTYLLPRSVISKHTAPWQLRFATTKACAWYRSLWRLFI